jgi:hypothetical protein
MIINELALYTFLGILLVTIIDALGSIASRKLDFNYGYFTPLSLAIYMLVGFMVSKEFGLTWAVISACIVGVFDATAGWQLSVALKANTGLDDEQLEKISLGYRIFGMIGIAALFGSLGYFVAQM